MSTTSGIYALVNKTNGNMYIGSSVDIRNRFASHLRELRRQIHCNCRLQNAYNRYGEVSFEKRILKGDLDKSLLRETEQWYLDNYKPEYNLEPAARGAGPKSEETKRKISETLKGFRHSDETKMKMVKSHKGKKRPKHSIKMIGSGNPMFGKKNPGASAWWKEYWRKKKEVADSVPV